MPDLQRADRRTRVRDGGPIDGRRVFPARCSGPGWLGSMLPQFNNLRLLC
jgi:hypothetical protein